MNLCVGLGSAIPGGDILCVVTDEQELKTNDSAFPDEGEPHFYFVLNSPSSSSFLDHLS